jgi:hypothetical protein
MKTWKIASCAPLAILATISIEPAVAAPTGALAGAEMLAASAKPLVSVQYRRWHHRHLTIDVITVQVRRC